MNPSEYVGLLLPTENKTKKSPLPNQRLESQPSPSNFFEPTGELPTPWATPKLHSPTSHQTPSQKGHDTLGRFHLHLHIATPSSTPPLFQHHCINQPPADICDFQKGSAINLPPYRFQPQKAQNFLEISTHPPDLLNSGIETNQTLPTSFTSNRKQKPPA